MKERDGFELKVSESIKFFGSFVLVSRVMIVVDTNSGEDRVFSRLQELVGSDIVERTRLDVADVEIRGLDGTTVCVERKTWGDLAGSICDGRFHEQKSRMVAENTRYVYAVEGDICDWTGSLRGMLNRSMWGALVKTILRDDKPVFHTRSTDDTAELCAYIHNQIKSGGFVCGGTKVVTGVSKRKRDNLCDPIAVLCAMLTNVPGVSASKAQCIIEAYPSVQTLCAADSKSLANIECGARKLGPKLASALKGVFNGEN